MGENPSWRALRNLTVFVGSSLALMKQSKRTNCPTLRIVPSELTAAIRAFAPVPGTMGSGNVCILARVAVEVHILCVGEDRGCENAEDGGSRLNRGHGDGFNIGVHSG